MEGSVRLCAIALALSMVLSLGMAAPAAPSSGWPTPHHDSEGTNTLDGQGVLSNPQVLWTQTFADAVTTPVVAAFGKVVVGTSDGTVAFLREDTGQLEYRSSLEGVPKWIGIIDQLPNGQLRTVAYTRALGSSSLVFLNGSQTQWQVRECFIGHPTLARNIQGSSGLVFGYQPCSGAEPGLAWIQVAGGSPIWLSADVAPVTPPRLGDLDRDGTPEIAVLDTTGRLALLTPDGRTLWMHDLNRGVVEAPVIGNFTRDSDQEILVPLDPEPILSLPANLSLYDRSGAVVWSATLDAGEILDVVAGNLRSESRREVVALLSDGRILALDGETGTRLWTINAGAIAIAGADLQGDALSDILALVEGGELISFNGLTGEPLWTVRLDTVSRSMALDHSSPGYVSIIIGGEDWVGVVSSSPQPGTSILVLALILSLTSISIAVAVLGWRWRRKRRRGPNRQSYG